MRFLSAFLFSSAAIAGPLSVRDSFVNGGLFTRQDTCVRTESTPDPAQMQPIIVRGLLVSGNAESYQISFSLQNKNTDAISTCRGTLSEDTDEQWMNCDKADLGATVKSSYNTDENSWKGGVQIVTMTVYWQHVKAYVSATASVPRYHLLMRNLVAKFAPMSLSRTTPSPTAILSLLAARLATQATPARRVTTSLARPRTTTLCRSSSSVRATSLRSSQASRAGVATRETAAVQTAAVQTADRAADRASLSSVLFETTRINWDFQQSRFQVRVHNGVIYLCSSRYSSTCLKAACVKILIIALYQT